MRIVAFEADIQYECSIEHGCMHTVIRMHKSTIDNGIEESFDNATKVKIKSNSGNVPEMNFLF